MMIEGIAVFLDDFISDLVRDYCDDFSAIVCTEKNIDKESEDQNYICSSVDVLDNVIKKTKELYKEPLLIIADTAFLGKIKEIVPSKYISVYVGENGKDDNAIFCTYRLFDSKYELIREFINKVWGFKDTGGVLSRNAMQIMIECGVLVKERTIENISNASYDLSLGDEYYYNGEISLLSERKPFIVIEPYDYVIASCAETINMPNNISARFDITVDLFCQGIILSNSTQVDPGFEGKLFCLLFNTSNKKVCLKRKMHYATIEFNKLIEETTPYSGKYRRKETIESYLPTNIMHGAINELKLEIEELKNESKTTQGIYLGVLALIIAILSIMIFLK